jgi:hypothetical protein
MKDALMKFVCLLTLSLLSAGACAQTPKLILLDGTPIKLRTTENLSSHDNTKGQDVSFEVLEDVFVDDVVVIKKGSIAIGTVTDAQPKRTMGRAGKLDIALDYVRLVDTEKAQLRGTKEGKGKSHTGAMTGAIVATAIVVWPAAPFFLFMHGKDIDIPKGTPVTAFVDGDFTVDPKAWARYETPQPAFTPVAAVTEASAPQEASEVDAQPSVGEFALRAKQHSDCLKLAADNPSITCQ